MEATEKYCPYRTSTKTTVKEEFGKQVTETDTSFRRCIGKECMAYSGILGHGCLMMESKG